MELLAYSGFGPVECSLYNLLQQPKRSGVKCGAESPVLASQSSALMRAPLQAAEGASEPLTVLTRGQEGPARPPASACIAMVGQREVREREVSEGMRNGWILVLKDVGFRGT